MTHKGFNQTTAEPIDTALYERARRSRDARFDGRFWVGVHSTGIYCRPVCPAPPAKRKNVEYFRSAAAAAAAGLRPCQRCRPEAAPGTPAWSGTSATVSRALRLIDEGALDGEGDVEELARRLGVGDRHLRRLFLRHLGATPVAVAVTRRLHFARRLIEESDLRISDVALAAGFGSVRRFNQAFRDAFHSAPSRLRRSGVTRTDSQAFDFRLAYRSPFDWQGLLSFFRPRAIPGVEQVTEDAYRRTFRWGDLRGWLKVAPCDPSSLRLRLRFERAPSPLPSLLPLVQKVRNQFDLDADPASLEQSFAADPVLEDRVRRYPGVRIPGAFDGFEVAVRAILGQQVTVKGATTLSGRLVAQHGTPIACCGQDGLTHCFPAAKDLAGADLRGIGLPQARAQAISGLAGAMDIGELDFDLSSSLEDAVARFSELPGIGDWTAQYIAMRVLRLPDAFPAGDLGLRKAASADEQPISAARLRAMSEAWRPWRAYAALLLWRS